MAASKFCAVLYFVFFVNVVYCQENAGTDVAPSLENCYNHTRLATRQYRLPSSIGILVELVRKMEDGNANQDARQMSTQFLHRFRQDGIRRTLQDVDSSLGLPFSPKGWEAAKNRVQLTKLTPGNAVNFNNNSLTELQSCSFHFMLSSTTETKARGDESSVCSRIAHYTQRVHKREISEFAEMDSTAKSSCPIESGVTYTKWGAIKTGLVMSGIAAGFQPNPVPTENGTVLSQYGSTIAGELAEVGLHQPTSTTIIGNKGGWNSTLEPKYYFLDQSGRENLYLTDAEIRGSLDGLFLGLNIQSWKSKFSNIKVSQILDLYYSRGVFNDSARACNRKTLLKEYIDSDTLEQQTLRFFYLLNPFSTLSYTPTKANFPTMANSAVTSFRSYINSNNLNDLECSAEVDLIERVNTDVLIFLDVSWNYETIQPFIAYILENLDINKYESSYTIFDGANCNIIINKTKSILDFHEYFNLTEQQKYPSGFDYQKVILKAQEIFTRKLDNQTDLTSSQSMIVLMLPRNTPTSSQSEYVRSKRNDFKGVLPDLRILVGGSGDISAYNDLVTTSASDIFKIQENSDDSALKSTATSLFNRFKKIPRSIVNPNCGSNFNSGTDHTFSTTLYVEPSAINYHKIAPNYFYEAKTLKIRGEGYGTLSVCTSRTEVNPVANTTGIECKNVNSEEISIDISNYCSGDSVIDCLPIYISVQGVTSSGVRCTDNNCRFPDNIKYTITMENVQCSSSSVKLVTSLFLIISLFVLMRFN